MIRRTSLLRPIERRFFKRRTRLKATQMANPLMGLVRRLGHTQWNMRPGSAVVPCRACKVLALAHTHTTGNPLLTTLTSLHPSSLGTVTSIFHGFLLVQGLTARTPG